MRTREQHVYAYNGLTTGEFAARTGQSAQQVRDMIAAGWFKVTADGMPECLDIRGAGSKQPTYRIHAGAVERFYAERGTAKPKRKAS